jgi:hypothetical protein
MSAAQALKAARDAGVAVVVDGDDLILEASAPPPAAILDSLSRNKAEVLSLLRATAGLNKPLTPTPSSLTSAPPAEPGLEEPCAARRGRVQEINGVLLHFCVECGRFGSLGCGVELRAGRLGRWYCRAHWPLTRAQESSERVETADPAEIQAEPAAAEQIEMVVEAMPLDKIQSELRAISGTPFRGEADRLRRRELWRRLDALCATSSLNNEGASATSSQGNPNADGETRQQKEDNDAYH